MREEVLTEFLKRFKKNIASRKKNHWKEKEILLRTHWEEKEILLRTHWEEKEILLRTHWEESKNPLGRN